MAPDCDACVAEYRERWKQPMQPAPRWSWLGTPQPNRWPRPDCSDANPTCKLYDAILSKLAQKMPHEAHKLADIKDEMVRRGEHRRPIGRPATRVCRHCDRLDCEPRWWVNKEEREKACPNAHPAAAARAQQRARAQLTVVPQDPRLPPEKDD